MLAVLLRASKPAYWIYTGGMYVVGLLSGLVALGGEVPQYIFAPVFLFFLWAVFGENFFGVLMNDYFDREADRHNPRKAASVRYEDSFFRWYWGAIGFSAVVFCFLAVYAGEPYLWLYGGIFFLGNIFYNVPPLRFKNRPPLGLIIDPVCALTPAFVAYTLLTHMLPPVWMWAAAGFFFLALDMCHELADREADRAAGIRTTALLLGRAGGIALCGVFLFLSFFSAWTHLDAPLFNVLGALMAALVLLIASAPGSAYSNISAYTPYLYMLIGFSMTSYLTALLYPLL